MISYPCGTFSDSFSLFLFYCADRYTQTDADERFTPATVVGVSKYVRLYSNTDVASFSPQSGYACTHSYMFLNT